MDAPAKPLIVQSDRTLLLEVDHPDAEACRAAIAPFAELERSPEHVHTYRITPLGLWNAGAAGHRRRAGGRRAPALVPLRPAAQALLVDVAETMARYGRLVHRRRRLRRAGAARRATSDAAVLEEVLRARKAWPPSSAPGSTPTVVQRPGREPGPPQAGAAQGRLAGRGPGRSRRRHRAPDRPATRPDGSCATYQRTAVDRRSSPPGSGVVVLPCGAGKTLVGAAAMAEVGTHTLILVTNTVSARQWRRELLARTSLTEDEIGEYSGERKEIRPVTIATYQILITRREGRVPPPRAVRRRGLGPDRLRRGPPPARAGVPHDRRYPEPAPPRPHRHARARGRSRGRRVHASSAPSATTPRGATSSARAGSPRRRARRCASASPTTERLAAAVAEQDERYRIGVDGRSEARRGRRAGRAPHRVSRRW